MSQHKSFSVPVFNIKSTAGDRIVTGVAAVFGNIDAGKDVIQPGAFRNAVAAFKAGKSRARFLWNHNSMEPPIAKILDIKEVSREQLPAAVLAKDPTAQGGLVVKRQYLSDPFSERIFQGIQSGVISEMSFAYDVKKSREEDRTGGSRVRILEELELFDLSDVNWGMNHATVAAGAKGRGRNRRIDPVLQRRVNDLVRTGKASVLNPSVKSRIDNLLRVNRVLRTPDLDALKQRALMLRARSVLS